jgi:hypothetical protein
MKRSYKQWLGAGLVGAAALFVGIDGAQAAVPDTVAFSGRLADADGPVDGTVSVSFRLFDAPSNGSALWNETHETFAEKGLVLVELGSDNAFDATVFDGSDRFLEIEINGETLSPRSRVGSVPYSMRAAEADHADHADLLGTLGPNDVQKVVNGACLANEAIRVIHPDGTVECEPDSDTTYTAGAGIAINGTTVSADFAQVQQVVSGTCGSNQSIQTINPNGSVVCDTDDNTTYTGSGGIVVNGTTISIATGGVTSAMILDDTIGAADIATSAVGALEIATDAVGSAEIATDAVGASEIASGAVGALEIATGAVGTSEINDGSIVDADVAANANIDPAKIGLGPTYAAAHFESLCGGVVMRYFMPVTVCIAGDSDGPNCSSVGVGGLCEADNECSVAMENLNNCGNAEWFIRVMP